MPFVVDGVARVAFTNTPGQVPGAPDNGELKVHQADGYLVTRKADGTSRQTPLDDVALNSNVATGGTVKRTLAARAGDRISLLEFGTPVAGDWTAVVSAAEASSAPIIYLPAGRYPTTLSYYQALSKVYVGPGKIVKADGTADAPFRAAITGQMAALSTDRTQIFDGDTSKMALAARTFVGSGANPSTIPSVYTNFPEWSQTVRIFDFTAGFNKDPADHALGRSGAFQDVMRLYHGGQGDLVQRNLFLTVYSSRAGATHFLASPAIAVDNGNIGSSVANAYLQCREFIFSDNGFAVAAIGDTMNYQRTNLGNALSQTWIHDRAQSTGSVPIDGFYVPFGKAMRGIDLTGADLSVGWNGAAEQAGIAMSPGQKIYLNAASTIDSIGAQFISHDLRNTSLYYSTAAGAMVFEVGGIAGLQVSSGQITNTVQLVQKLQGPGTVIPQNYMTPYQPTDATKLAFKVQGPDNVTRYAVLTLTTTAP